MNGMDLCKETHITLGLVHVSIVISRQSSPHFACALTHDARDPLPLCSPSLHLNLTYEVCDSSGCHASIRPPYRPLTGSLQATYGPRYVT
jgi:hypothetical protein